MQRAYAWRVGDGNSSGYAVRLKCDMTGMPPQATLCRVECFCGLAENLRYELWLFISLLMKTSGFRRILLYHSRSFEGRDNITVERNLSYMTPEDRLHRSHRGDFYADNLSFSSIF